MPGSKIRVLHIGPDGKGGVSSLVKLVMHNYIFFDPEVQLNVLYSTSDGSKVQKFLFTVSFFFKMLFKLLFGRIDVVHIHSASNSSFRRKSIVIILTKLFFIKVILHLHGGGFSNYCESCSKIEFKFIKVILKMVDTVFVVSNYLKEELSDKGLRGDLKVAPNFINFDKNFTLTEELIRRRYENLVLGYMGRFTAEKGVYRCLDVFDDLSSRYPLLTLHMAGGTDIDKKKGVEIYGWLEQEDKNTFYRDITVLLNLSEFESFGMSILEAQSLGVPVVAFNVGGVSDVIVRDKSGFLVDDMDLQVVSLQVETLLNDFKLYRVAAINSFESAKRFRSEKVLSMWKSHYLELVSEI